MSPSTTDAIDASSTAGWDLPDARAARTLSCVVTTTRTDCHTWNLVVLELLLREAGHQVRNVGPCPSDDLVAQVCRAASADLVVVSTMNGHGADEAVRLIGVLRAEPSLTGAHIVIGGMLSVTKYDPVVGKLRRAGFDHVFVDCADGEVLVKYVRRLARAEAAR